MSTVPPPPVRLTSLHGRGVPLARASEQRAHLRRLPIAREFHDALRGAGIESLVPTPLRVFQINLGKLCNQTCRHCHVDAGPDREESMSRETVDACLRAIAATAAPVVDITGGAPELHPEFRRLVMEARRLGKHVMNRCNLTVLETERCRDLPAFFAEHEVEVVGSLPHFRAPSTDRQRGAGVYEKSIAALRRLNDVGYGKGDAARRLVLVTNPVGAFLPASQGSLEAEWKRELRRLHGVEFDALLALTNMPIARYLEWLEDSGNLEDYLERLVTAFNPIAAGRVMCRDTISVAWDGTLHDCDFNQMLEMPCDVPAPSIFAFDEAALARRHIATDRHCYGCTAGAGSSCGGSLT